MTPDEHNPEGTDHAAQGHALAASKPTPPAATPTPALPPEVRAAITLVALKQFEGGMRMGTVAELAKRNADEYCAALAAVLAPVLVRAEAAEREVAKMLGRLRGEHGDDCPFCAKTRGYGETQTNPMCHLCAVESERDQLRAEVERLAYEANDWMRKWEEAAEAAKLAKQEVERLTKRLAEEEKAALELIGERDEAERILDDITSDILGEPIDWPHHDAKWAEAAELASEFRHDVNDLRAQLADARQAVAAAQDACHTYAVPVINGDLVGAINQLGLDRQKLMADKERLDWLEGGGFDQRVARTFNIWQGGGMKFRAAIDAARREGGRHV